MHTQLSRAGKHSLFGGKSSGSFRGKALGITAIGSLMILLAGCGSGSMGAAGSVSSTKESTSASPSPTPTPTPSQIAGKACAAEKNIQSVAGETYICTIDQSGNLVWLDSATAGKLSDQRAADVAAKAAAEKAAADAAAKAAADKAAADKAAADKLAADQAAAAKAAADQAAADQAAAAAAKPAPAPAVQSGCDPNYAGACVPIASDVDCAGGKGNGPAYVRGPVTVVGSDIYGLDNDHDGIGCE
ncbi:hypothetical protein [Arthrobacter sp. NtRootA1]|uniref:hypothetical protein n=1 Tax=Arthrobacter sp. NtRootA1 TaxID=2830983 RepID=UPI001CC69CEF|nr:hypothetical protein [Arthrobacter sp. NtRootA1]